MFPQLGYYYRSVADLLQWFTKASSWEWLSNYYFVEQEEIMEWWFNTSEAGAEIPSEEDLTEKIKKKIMLGL